MAVGLADLKGLWRRHHVWPWVICGLVWMIFGKDEERVAEQLGSFLEWVFGLSVAMTVLLGLAVVREDREGRFHMRIDSFAIRYSEVFAGKWLALSVYMLSVFSTSAGVAWLAYTYGSGDAVWEQGFREDLTGPAVGREDGYWVIDIADKAEEGNVLVLQGSFWDENQRPSTIAAFVEMVYETEKVNSQGEVKILAGRRVEVPFPKELEGIRRVHLAAGIQMEGKRIFFQLDQAWWRHKGHPPGQSFFQLCLTMSMQILMLSGLVVGIGRMVSMETGLFLISGLAVLIYMFSVLGEDAMRSAVELQRRNGTEGVVVKVFWWESLLVKWSESIAFTEEGLRLLRLDEHLNQFKSGEVISPLWSRPKSMAAFTVLFAGLLLLIPLSGHLRRN